MTTMTPPLRVGRGSRVRTVRTVRERAAIKPGDSTEVVALISSAFTMVAIICTWFALQVLVLGGLAQSRDQSVLYDMFRTQLAEATAPLGPVVDPGAPVAVLTIPRLGVQQVVVEGTSSGDLVAGPGHRRDTVLPGQSGVSLIYGRASTYGAPFADVAALRVGDEMIAQTGQARTVFTVENVRRDGDPVTAPAAGSARLTLVTAEGHGLLASLRPSRTVFVDAISAEAQPVPAGRPAGVPASELAMASDPAATPMLALGLALLTLLTLGVVAARQRWSLALVWVVAAPVAIAVSWFTTDQLMRLLPNLI